MTSGGFLRVPLKHRIWKASIFKYGTDEIGSLKPVQPCGRDSRIKYEQLPFDVYICCFPLWQSSHQMLHPAKACAICWNVFVPLSCRSHLTRASDLPESQFCRFRRPSNTDGVTHEIIEKNLIRSIWHSPLLRTHDFTEDWGLRAQSPALGGTI